MPRITHHLRTAVTRALRQDHLGEQVHFHAGDHGRPYVCEDRRCTSPSLGTAPS